MSLPDLVFSRPEAESTASIEACVHYVADKLRAIDSVSEDRRHWIPIYMMLKSAHKLGLAPFFDTNLELPDPRDAWAEWIAR